MATLAAILAFGAVSASALTSSQVQTIKNSVLGVPVPEMPAKAAQLVKEAGAKDKQAVAATAVKAVVAKHPAAAPLVISAISKVAPEIAPAIAAVAAELSQEQAPLIARAAVVAAPGQASAVSTAVSLAAPKRATVVANAVGAVGASSARTGTRGSALGGNSAGVVVISDRPIGGGAFPTDDPDISPAPIIIYSTPPSE